MSKKKWLKSILASSLVLQPLSIWESSYSHISYADEAIQSSLAAPEVFIDKDPTEAAAYIKWRPVAGATEYELYRDTLLLASIQDSGTEEAIEYTDLSVQEGDLYEYRVRAMNGEKPSDFSNSLSIVMNVVPNPSIRQIRSVYDKIVVDLSWEGSPGAAHYKIDRKNQRTDETVTFYTEDTGMTDTFLDYQGESIVYTIEVTSDSTASYRGNQRTSAPWGFSTSARPGDPETNWVRGLGISFLYNNQVYLNWQYPYGSTSIVYKNGVEIWKELNGGTYMDSVELDSVNTYQIQTTRPGFPDAWSEEVTQEGPKKPAFGYPMLAERFTTPHSVELIFHTVGSSDAKAYVYRDGIFIGESTTESYTDDDVKPNTSYTYTVKFLENATHKESPLSSPLVATTTDWEYPTLKVDQTYAGATKISWNSVWDAAAYNVYRDGVYLERRSKYDAPLNFMDKETKAGRTYIYTVEIITGSELSKRLTQPVSVKVLAAPKIEAPANLTAAVDSENHRIQLNWTGTENAEGYGVYKDGQEVWTTLDTSDNQYPSMDVESEYHVVAYQFGISSEPSNTVKATLPGFGLNIEAGDTWAELTWNNPDEIRMLLKEFSPVWQTHFDGKGNRIRLEGLNPETSYYMGLVKPQGDSEYGPAQYGEFKTLPVGEKPSPIDPTPLPVEPTPIDPTPSPIEPPPIGPTPSPVEPNPIDPTPAPVEPICINPLPEPVQSEDGFFDLSPADYGFDEIVYMKKLGVIYGMPNLEFFPDRPVSRVEFAIMLKRALRYSSLTPYHYDFEDIDLNAWYGAELTEALNNRITRGFNDRTYRPNDVIPREQAAIMLSNVLRNHQYTFEHINDFYDLGDAVAWSRADIAMAGDAGIVVGDGGRRFKPKEHLTRRDAALMVYRTMLLTNSETDLNSEPKESD